MRTATRIGIAAGGHVVMILQTTEIAEMARGVRDATGIVARIGIGDREGMMGVGERGTGQEIDVIEIGTVIEARTARGGESAGIVTAMARTNASLKDMETVMMSGGIQGEVELGASHLSLEDVINT